MDGLDEGSPRIDDLRRDWMRTPDEAAAMVRLKGLGWGVRRIAAEFGCSRETVRRYVKAGGFVDYPGRSAPAFNDRDEDLLDGERRRLGAQPLDHLRQQWRIVRAPQIFREKARSPG